MKLNAQTAIWTDLLVLVPYRASHVPTYHGWMQSAELQQLTASEPLTLPEEFDMQQSWLQDDNKCTFILLDRLTFERTRDQQKSMVGDVNLFLLGDAAAEAEVMVAERWARGAGRGRQATAAMLRYGVHTLCLSRFEVKIGLANEASRRMFAGMGFAEVSRSEVFREVTMEATDSPEWRSRLERLSPGYLLQPADDETPSEKTAAAPPEAAKDGTAAQAKDGVPSQGS